MLGNRHACKMRRKKSAVCVWRRRFNAASVEQFFIQSASRPPTTPCLSILAGRRKRLAQIIPSNASEHLKLSVAGNQRMLDQHDKKQHNPI